jgi:hypothetical protein
MVSIKVKVLNKDNRFGGRNIDVSLGSHSFKTPNRIATHKDYLSVSALPHKVTIENPVSEYVSAFDNRSLDDFLQGNGSFKDRSRKIDQGLNLMRYYPTISSIRVPAGRRLAQEKLMLFDQLQKGDFEIISIPPFEYNDINEYKKIIIEYSDFVRARGQEAMPILPLSTKLTAKSPTFKLEFNALKELNNDNGICKIIGFAYADPFSHIQQYQSIYESRDEDIWYHVFGVPKAPRNKLVAHIHELQNWGIDTVSPEVKYIQPKAVSHLVLESKNIRPEEVVAPRRFDFQTLGVLKEIDWTKKYGHDICCDCPVCSGKDLASFKDTYMHDLDGSFAPRLLYDADRTHTLISGSNEFFESKEAIKADDLPTYFDEREFTKSRQLNKYLG